MSDRPTAIVVDDSKAFLMYLSVLLNRMNLEVMPVSCPAEALDLARVTRPNLMTLDMVMPDMDGIETLRMIRQDEDLADLPVIMISSYQDGSRWSEAHELGCVDILDKPVELRRLHRALQQCNLYGGGRRRYLRAPYSTTVTLKIDDDVRRLPSVTLSERGIFVETRKLLRRGQAVKIELPLPCDDVLSLHGKVIYTKSETGAHFIIPQGMAIKFEHLTTRDMELLGEAVTEILIGDILAQQEEMILQAH